MTTQSSLRERWLPLARWWATRPPGEQRVMTLAGSAAFVALAILYIAIPLARDAEFRRAALEREAANLQDARATASDIVALSRTAAPAASPDSKGDVERVLAARGVRALATEFEWQNTRARIVFTAIDFPALVALLEALQREARMSVVEARLTARVEPGSVRAEVTLAR